MSFLAKNLTLKTNLTISYSHFHYLCLSALPSLPHPSSTQAHNLSASSLTARPLRLTLSASIPRLTLSASPSLPRPLCLTLSASVPRRSHSLPFASPSPPHSSSQSLPLCLALFASLSNIFFFLLILTGLKYWVFFFFLGFSLWMSYIFVVGVGW